MSKCQKSRTPGTGLLCALWWFSPVIFIFNHLCGCLGDVPKSEFERKKHDRAYTNGFIHQHWTWLVYIKTLPQAWTSTAWGFNVTPSPLSSDGCLACIGICWPHSDDWRACKQNGMRIESFAWFRIDYHLLPLPKRLLVKSRNDEVPSLIVCFMTAKMPCVSLWRSWMWCRDWTNYCAT